MQQQTAEMPVQQEIQCEKNQTESSKEEKSAASTHLVKSSHSIKDQQNF